MATDIKSIIGKPQERQFQIDSTRSVNEKDRTIELSFSSEAMVPMWYGMESLSHDTGAADLSRILDGGSVLMDHDEVRWVGGIQSARIDQDRKGRALIKFGENALARDVWPDVASGLRKLISVRYNVLDAIPAKTADGVEYIKVTRWQPVEISFVSVPADTSVGVGRSLTQSQQQNNRSMPENNSQDTGGQTATQQAPANQNQAPQSQRSATTQTAPPPQAPQEQQPQQRDLSANVVITGGEAQRASQQLSRDASEIRSLALQYGAAQEGMDYIVNGRSAGDFKDFLLQRAAQRDQAHKNGKTMLGLSSSEARRFSIMKAARVAAFPNNEKYRQAAGFELECSRAAQEIWGQSGDGSISIPPDILMAPETMQSYRSIVEQRAFNLSAGAGAINEGLRPQNFIEFLRNRTVAFQLGVGYIQDVQGKPNIPKQSASADAAWLSSEDAAAPDADAAVSEQQMAPKHVGAKTYLTRDMLVVDSIGIEGLLTDDLIKKVAVAVDKAVFHGSGSSGQPTGLAAAGIGSVAIGTNGGNMTYAKSLEFMTDVDTSNALMGNIAYVTTPGVKGFLMQALKTSGVSGYIWNDLNSSINGYPAIATNQIASNLTKGTSSGVCHAMFFGNFQDFVIFSWGPLEFMRDPYSNSSKGGVTLRVFQSVDFLIRHLGSFSACLDITV